MTKMRVSRRLIVCLAGLLLLVVALGLNGCGRKAAVNDKIAVSGTVEATETSINAETGGKIKEILVHEGNEIKQGAVLVRLDSNILALQAQQAEAALNAAREASAQTKIGNRQQVIAQAQAGVQQSSSLAKGAKKSMESAQENLKMITTLVNAGGSTAQQLLDAQTRFDTAKAQYEAYSAQVKSATEQLNLLKSGATKETVNIANASVAQAQAAFSIAKAQLEKAVIYAPTGGVISSVNFQKGEFVTPGAPIFTVVDPHDLWIEVYISEKELPKIKLNQKAEIFTDAYPDKPFHGEISFISTKAEFTPKNLQTKEERVNMVFMVKIKITDGLDQLKPGLPADVEITTK